MAIHIDYNESTQTKIVEGSRPFVFTDTGEAGELKQIAKTTYGAKQFWKCYLMDFLHILGILDSKQCDVLVYICENTRTSDNLFIGTYDKIMKDVGVSRPTIATIMRKLQENDFLKKVQNGVYMVNPDIMMKGNDPKRHFLISYYQADNPIDEITKAKTKKDGKNE